VAAAAQTCARCFPEEAGELLEGMLLLTEARAAALRRMRALLVLSTYMAQELCTAGIPGAEVFPPWVDSLPAGPLDPAAGLQHLLAGRLTWHKGVDLALAASEVGLPLALAGRGPLEEVARAAGHRCLGWLDRAGLAAALGQSRSLWMPGRWAEPWGIAGLEAQWMGLPVLASAVGGVAEWLEHGEGGLLLPPNDAVALREAATQLSRDPALARRLGRRGCERARAEAGPQRGWALWQRLEEWAGGRGERR
jgi:glycosyltransferase involved in cell wall biosynthesis